MHDTQESVQTNQFDYHFVRKRINPLNRSFSGWIETHTDFPVRTSLPTTPDGPFQVEASLTYHHGYYHELVTGLHSTLMLNVSFQEIMTKCTFLYELRFCYLDTRTIKNMFHRANKTIFK